MTISSKHASWKEFHLSKEKETKLFPAEPMEYGGTGTGDAFAFLDDPLSFTNLVALLEDECFLLLPAGGNRVNLVHSCFKAWVDEEGPSVFGILGSRRSSPFKRVNAKPPLESRDRKKGKRPQSPLGKTCPSARPLTSSETRQLRQEEPMDLQARASKISRQPASFIVPSLTFLETKGR